jgi:hypothetical protein
VPIVTARPAAKSRVAPSDPPPQPVSVTGLKYAPPVTPSASPVRPCMSTAAPELPPIPISSGAVATVTRSTASTGKALKARPR